MKELNTLQEPSVCDVCGRSMLKGERVEPYLTPGGDRRFVCELCRHRVEGEGWTHAQTGEQRAPATPRDRNRRQGILGRLRSPASGEPLARSEDALPEPGAEVGPGAPDQSDAAPEPAYEGADRERSPEPGAEAHRHDRSARVRDKLTRPLLRDPRHVRAVPASPEARVQLALELFNQSEHPRTVAGITRSLGQPHVSAGASANRPSEVRLTVAWELSWYQFAVDLSDERDPVRVTGKGQEVGDLDGPAKEWNSHATEEGLLGPGLEPAEPE